MAFRIVILAFLAAGSSLALSDQEERSSPWVEALRQESFYRKCHSSCTEYSKGTTTRVELCDDTEVMEKMTL